jgi:thiol-disulfide isomerase/thioredoxin
MRGIRNLNHIFLLAFLLQAVCARAVNGYKITLKSNLKNHKVYLYYQYGEDQYPLDTAVASEDGTAVFEGKEQLTGGVFLIYFTPDRAMEFFLTDENNFTIQTDTGNITAKTTFTGSRENSIYYDFLRKVKFNEFQRDVLKEKLRENKYSADSVKIVRMMIGLYDRQNTDLKKQTIEKNKNSFMATLLRAYLPVESDPTWPATKRFAYEKAHFFDGIDFSDERLAYSQALFVKYKEYINDYVYHEGDSIIVACDTILKKAAAGKENFKWSLYFLSSSFERSAFPGNSKIFVHLVDEYYRKGKCWWLTEPQLTKMYKRSEVLKHLFIGATCPDFTASDSSGKPVNLHKSINKLTVLYFWSYDCEHCLEETPRLVEWAKKHKHIELITACVTPDEDRWKEKLRGFKIPGIHVIDPELKANYIYTYNITSTPEIFVIDKDKKILAEYLDDVKQLDEFIEKTK